MPSLAASGPNADQIRYWNEHAGPRWVAPRRGSTRRSVRSARSRASAPRFARASACSTSAAAAAAPRSRSRDAVGAVGHGRRRRHLAPDARPRAATRRAREAGGPHRVPARRRADRGLRSRRLDLVFSRFGVMFFADPIAAFANLRGALRPGGRVAFVCWQPRDRNPWMTVPLAAAAQHIAVSGAAPARRAGPLRLRAMPRACAASSRRRASRGRDRAPRGGEAGCWGGGGSLEGRGRVHGRDRPGGDGPAQGESRRRCCPRVAMDAVREALAPFATPAGVKLGSAAWIVRAV